MWDSPVVTRDWLLFLLQPDNTKGLSQMLENCLFMDPLPLLTIKVEKHLLNVVRSNRSLSAVCKEQEILMYLLEPAEKMTHPEALLSYRMHAFQLSTGLSEFLTWKPAFLNTRFKEQSFLVIIWSSQHARQFEMCTKTTVSPLLLKVSDSPCFKHQYHQSNLQTTCYVATAEERKLHDAKARSLSAVRGTAARKPFRS